MGFGEADGQLPRTIRDLPGLCRGAPLSFLFEPVHAPEGAFMKRIWQRSERLACQIEKEPCRQKAQQTLGDAERGGKTASLEQRRPGEFLEAGSADDAVIVFSNAFAAKEMGARGAKRDRFPLGVIEAALMDEAHEMMRGGALGSSTM
jgi:hypothetical protein